MIKVILNLGNVIVEAKGFDPDNVAAKAGKAADQALNQLTYLRSTNSALQQPKNVPQQSKSPNLKPVPKEKE